MRKSIYSRETKETNISLVLNLDGKGEAKINTGCGFLDHMLELFASHARFDLELVCKGDLQVDLHHSVEDCAISLGEAFAAAIGDKKGISRYASIILPMDETLILAATDISGRALLCYDLVMPNPKVGVFDTELVQEFFLGFIRASNITLHLKQLAGTNTHHIIEGAFKSFARALRAAVSLDEKYADEIPSTKGSL